MSKFKVGTFYERRGDTPKISHVSAYTLWYSAEMSRCIEYEVEAQTAKEAKRRASEMRLAHELGKSATAAKEERADGE